MEGSNTNSPGTISIQEMETKMTIMENHIEDLLDRNIKSNTQIDSLVETIKNRDAALAQYQQESLEMTQRIALLDQQLGKRDSELKQLRSEKLELTHQLAEAVGARRAIMLKLDNIASCEEAFNNSQRLQVHEMELLRCQKKSMEDQLLQLEAQLLALQSGSREAQLQNEVQTMQNELHSSNESVAGLKTLLIQEQARVQLLLEQVDTARAEERVMQEVHVREMEAQHRVVQLCQEESKEARNVADHLSSTVSTLQKALVDASEKYKSLETNVEKDKSELKNQLILKDKSIDLLKEELSEVKSLLEKTKTDAIESFVEQMFPDAAILGRHLPPDMSMSQIFMQYTNATKELDCIKSERDQLSLKLGFLTNDLKEKESEIIATRAALDEIQQDAQKLQVEQRHLISEYKEAQSVAQEAVQKATQHAKDKTRLQGQVEDLSAQVVQLLGDLEAIKENRSAEPLPSESLSSPPSERLLLFRNVSELQHCNKELLAALRDMQERAEQAEHALSDSQDIRELQTRLEETKEEVRRLQNSNMTQRHLIDTLVRQRDQFEKLSKKPESMDVSVETDAVISEKEQLVRQPLIATPPVTTPPIGVAELRLRLRKAEEALANVNKDYDMFRQDSRNQFTMVTEQLETMRTSLSESKLAQAKLRAECETAKERLSNAKANNNALNNQIEGLRSLRETQDYTIERQEKALVEVHRELVNIYTKLSQSETLVAQLQADLRKQNRSEAALRYECEALKKSTSAQQMLLLSAQELKACRLTAEAEQRLVLIQRLDASELSNKQLNEKLQVEEERFKTELTKLQSMLDITKSNLEQAKAENACAEENATRLTERLAQAERDVLAMRAHRHAVTEAEVQTDLLGRDEQGAVEHLGALQEQVTSLTQLLATSRSEVEKEHSQVQAAESKIVGLEDSLKKSLLEITQRNSSLATCRIEVGQLLSKISSLETFLADARGEKTRIHLQLMNTKGDLSRAQIQLQKLQQQNRAQPVAIPSAQPTAVVPVDNSALQALQEELAHAKENVQRLETQHQQDLRAISTFRKQCFAATASLQELKAKLQEKSEESPDAKSCSSHDMPVSLSCTTTSQLEQDSLKAAQLNELQELRVQNSALLDQIQSQFTELCKLREQQSACSSEIATSLNTSGSFSEDDTTSPERMLLILRYLSREKQVAISQAESLEAKITGLQMQLEKTQRELTVAKNLTENVNQKEKSNVNVVEVALERYKEMTHKLETLDALIDSNIIQREKCVQLEQQVSQLQVEVQSLTKVKEEMTVFKEDLEKAVEKLKAQQVELVAVRGEAARWRSRANQLSERTNRANNEEIKRLQTERDILQRQLTSELEELRKERDNEVTSVNAELARTSEELTKVNTEMLVLSEEVTRVSGALSGTKEQIQKLEEEKNIMTETLNAKDAQIKEVTTKEIQLRRIAKKYKTQYEELLKTVEEERAARQEQGINANSVTTETQEINQRLTECEARTAEAEARATAAETKITEKETELGQAEAKITEMQQQISERIREVTMWEERSERMRSVLQTAKQRIGEGNAGANRLQQELNSTNANLETQRRAREEAEMKLTALQNRFDSVVARLEQQVQQMEQENAMLRNGVSEGEQGVQQPASRQLIRYIQQSGAGSTDKTGNETPTANIRPMAGPSQPKAQQSQQSVAVPPTSRSAPMARLRPMSMSPRSMVVVPSQQQQQQAVSTPSSTSSSVALSPRVQVASSAGISEPSTSRQPAVSVSPMGGTSGREEVMPTPASVAEPSTSHESAEPSDEVPQSNQQTAGVAVLLVRPQEVQPTVSSSQNIQSTTVATSTSSQPRPTPPTLKRTRDESSSKPEEPQMKHVCMEVTSGNAETVAVVAPSPQEEPSSSHGQAYYHTVMTDEREADAQNTEPSGEDGSRNENMAMEGESSCVSEQRQEGNNNDNEVIIIDIDSNDADETEEQDNIGQAEPSSSSGPPSARHSELVRAVEALLDSGANSGQSEPSSSSGVIPRSPSLRPAQAHLVLQQGYEEIGDDSIVPSTPTLFVPRRREGFGDGVSSPQVPQAHGRLFTFAPESISSPMSAPQVPASGSSDILEESHLESSDDPGSGRSVPSTPLLISPQDMIPNIAPSTENQPQETPQISEIQDELDEADSDMPTSSSNNVPSILITPASAISGNQQVMEAGESCNPAQEMSELRDESDLQETDAEPAQQIMTSPSQRRLLGRRETARRSPQHRPRTIESTRSRAPIVWNDSRGSEQLRGISRGIMRGRLSPRMIRRGGMPQGSMAGVPPLMSRGAHQSPTRRGGMGRTIRRPF